MKSSHPWGTPYVMVVAPRPPPTYSSSSALKSPPSSGWGRHFWSTSPSLSYSVLMYIPQTDCNTTDAAYAGTEVISNIVKRNPSQATG